MLLCQSIVVTDSMIEQVISILQCVVRVAQAYIIDCYCCMEESRLNHFRKKSFQHKYGEASYNEICATVTKGVTEGSQVGHVIVLPSTHIGGPRYLYQNYLDCVALCRRHGCHDLFITFTSNSLCYGQRLLRLWL